MTEAASCCPRDHFGALSAPRSERTKRHDLLDIITIALCAVLGGADSGVELGLFGRAGRAWPRTFRALPHGIPSHDPFGRVFARLAPHPFEQCFLARGQTRAPRPDGEVVASAGQTRPRRPVLGQLAVAAGPNEIPTRPALLASWALDGCIVTIAAIGCQTAITPTISDHGAA